VTRFREIDYMSWAKALPPARVNLARSGTVASPPRLLRPPRGSDLTRTPAGYGWLPLRRALAARYGVTPDRVLTVSGGASLANFLACAAALHGARPGAEVLLERPAYEPLLRAPQALGARVARFERRFEDGFGVDLERFVGRLTPRTRLAIVSNLHNPSGARIPQATLRGMARALARVGGVLLVDEVYLECLMGDRGVSSAVHAGPNVVATNSLTKAYGLDGLRAGWLLGPRALIRRAGLIHDLLGVNGVAPGEHLALAAVRNLGAIRRRSRALLERNRGVVARFLARERRISAALPPGGSVLLARLPAGLTGRRFAAHLRRRYATLVVPGEFFEARRCVRISLGGETAALREGLARISRALDELTRARYRSVASASRRRAAPPVSMRVGPWRASSGRATARAAASNTS
jgi:aspartate/methionine/tyrosine aminotransferase